MEQCSLEDNGRNGGSGARTDVVGRGVVSNVGNEGLKHSLHESGGLKGEAQVARHADRWGRFRAKDHRVVLEGCFFRRPRGEDVILCIWS